MANNSLTVLCLHRVSDDFNPSWPALKIKEFENILSYLHTYYEVIDFNTYFNKKLNETKQNKKPYVVITFDDGYHDFYENALPLLTKFKFKSNLNIVYNAAEHDELIWTQKIHCLLEENLKHNKSYEITYKNKIHTYDSHSIADVSNNIIIDLMSETTEFRQTFVEHLESISKNKVSYTPLMNWQQVNAAISFDVSIGSHTISHAVFNKNSTETELDTEIIFSKKEIEKRIDRPVNTIALPNGLYTERVLSKCNEGSYSYVLLVDGGYNNVNKFNDKLSIIKRVLIHKNNFYANVLDIEHVPYLIKKLIAKR